MLTVARRDVDTSTTAAGDKDMEGHTAASSHGRRGAGI